MTLIQTAILQPDFHSATEVHQIYNGLDCCLTVEIFEELTREYGHTNPIYAFERALQAPALEMMMRGFRIDKYERDKAVGELQEQLRALTFRLDAMALAVWGKTLNPRSQPQLQEFFYKVMGLPEIWTSKKGKRVLSMDRETLEKLELYFFARPIVACILSIREIAKKIEVLTTEIDYDGRMRTSYNIAGTETGRWSSSSSSTGTGTNLQNITGRLRKIFVADPGYKLCGIDLEQAESREVGLLCGLLFNDWTYLDACESGDLHTTTCRMIWANQLKWTGQTKLDKALAEQPFYRDFSYRDMSKRGGHGSNYYGTPWTMSRHLKVPVKFMEDFQAKYFTAFPGIPRWHRWVAEQLQTVRLLQTPWGRERHFFGRQRDDATLREAIAFSPQSATGDRMNLGLWRIWSQMGHRVQLLAQVHDAVYFQYPECDSATEAQIISDALALVQITTQHSGRSFCVPGEAKVGWNWGNHHNPHKPTGPANPFNPNGLVKWTGADNRVRQEGLDRIL